MQRADRVVPLTLMQFVEEELHYKVFLEIIEEIHQLLCEDEHLLANPPAQHSPEPSTEHTLTP